MSSPNSAEDAKLRNNENSNTISEDARSTSSIGTEACSPTSIEHSAMKSPMKTPPSAEREAPASLSRQHVYDSAYGMGETRNIINNRQSSRSFANTRRRSDHLSLYNRNRCASGPFLQHEQMYASQQATMTSYPSRLPSNSCDDASRIHSGTRYTPSGEMYQQTNKTLNCDQDEKSLADYLSQLIKDKQILESSMRDDTGKYFHLNRLLDDEIIRVRVQLFQPSDQVEDSLLPTPEGRIITLSEKIYIPAREYPDFNFVGRILGPRGLTVQQLEKQTGCKIMIRGKGSIHDKKKDSIYSKERNFESLMNDELHVLVTAEDAENRAAIKVQRGVEEVQKLLVPVAEGIDELKKRQLLELAILNGTYRGGSANNSGQSVNSINESGAVRQASNGSLPPFVTINQPTMTQLNAFGTPHVRHSSGLPESLDRWLPDMSHSRQASGNPTFVASPNIQHVQYVATNPQIPQLATGQFIQHSVPVIKNDYQTSLSNPVAQQATFLTSVSQEAQNLLARSMSPAQMGNISVGGRQFFVNSRSLSGQQI